MTPEIKSQAQGRWPSILVALGVPEVALQNKHGPCPICGGKDRFRYDDRDAKGTWICGKCGAGDGISLVMGFKGVDFKGAVKLVREVLPTAKPVTPRRERPAADTARMLREMWEQAKPVARDDDVDRYLRGRALGMDEYPTMLRTHPALAYYDEDRKLVGAYPAMLAKVADQGGRCSAIHRTYLQDGKKAPVDQPKKIAGKSKGGAIRLWPAADVLCVAEGIETAIAVRAITGLPVWSLISAGNMESWAWPAVQELRIYGDNDCSFTGQKAAFALAYRAHAKGIEVQVNIPTEPDTDYGDQRVCRELPVRDRLLWVAHG